MSEPGLANDDHLRSYLLKVWRALFPDQEVGADDNFFTLGGNSLLALVAVSRARHEGIELTLEQIVAYPTVRELTELVGVSKGDHVRGSSERKPGPSGDGPEPGAADVPLTVEQATLLAEATHPEHHVGFVVLEPVHRVDPATLERAFTAVAAHHEAFRLRFERAGGGWRQWVAPDVGPITLLVRDASQDQHDAAADPAEPAVDRAVVSLRSTVDLAHGPVVALGLVDCGVDLPQRILLVAHHLVVDTLSIDILLSDIARAHEQLASGAQPALPATTPFSAAVLVMHRYASSPAGDRTEPWRLVPWQEARPIPADRPGGPVPLRSVRTVAVRLAGEPVRALLRASRRHGTSVDRLLVTALAATVREWTAHDLVVIGLATHGRAGTPGAVPVDLTRTVGWLSFGFPLVLHLPPASTDPLPVGLVMRQIDVQMAHAWEYSLALAEAAKRGESESGLGITTQAFLNFTHVPDQPPAAQWWRRLARAGEYTDPDGVDESVMDIHAVLRGESLQIDWRYSECRHDRATIEARSERFLGHLDRLCRLV